MYRVCVCVYVCVRTCVYVYVCVCVHVRVCRSTCFIAVVCADQNKVVPDSGGGRASSCFYVIADLKYCASLCYSFKYLVVSEWVYKPAFFLGGGCNMSMLRLSNAQSNWHRPCSS